MRSCIRITSACSKAASLPRAPIDLEMLGERVSLSAGAMAAALIELELNGLVQQYPGKVYEKI